MTTLPEYVEVCPTCQGTGRLRSERCPQCFRGDWPREPVGYVYRATGKPVPQSVEEQIKNANAFHATQLKEE